MTIDPTSAQAATWRVQWYSRNGIDAPERAEGRQYFDTEDDARAWFTFEEVADRVAADPYWRVELQHRPPWQTVEAGTYTEGS